MLSLGYFSRLGSRVVRPLFARPSFPPRSPLIVPPVVLSAHARGIARTASLQKAVDDLPVSSLEKTLSNTVTGSDIASWSSKQVYRWAVDDVGLDEEDARLLVSQKINGKALLKMTEEKLERYGLPGGPATNLFEAIQHLKQAPGLTFLRKRILNTHRTITPGLSAFSGTDGPIARRPDVLDTIFAKLETTCVVSLPAPPFSGKSSLAVLLGQEALCRGWTAFYIPLSPQKSPLDSVSYSCNSTFPRILASNDKTLLIFDDTQAIYARQEEDFWGLVKQHESELPSSPVKLLFLSTIRKDRTTPSPFVFTHILPSSLLLATNPEVEDIFEDYDRLAPTPLSSYLRDVVHRLAGGHIGLLRQTLFKIWEYRHHHPTLQSDEDAVSFLLDSSFHSYLSDLRITFDFKSFTPDHRQLLSRALDGLVFEDPGTTGYDICLQLVDFGLLIETQKRGQFQFSSPLVRRVVLKRLYTAESRPDSPPSSLREFVLQALRLLEISVMQTSLSQLKIGTPKEDLWQKEFYRVSTSLLPKRCTLSAEVSKVFGDEECKGVVDFYADQELQWMVEFLVEGRELQEHVDRFKPEGQYRHLRRHDWLVVDFRVKAPPPSQLLPHVMYVLCAEDYCDAIVKQDSFPDEKIKFSDHSVRTVSDL